MQASIVIISKDRKSELFLTLKKLEGLLDLDLHEVLVFLDGCSDDSAILREKFTWVKWFVSEKSLGASAARNKLYPNASGKFLIGLDDDAHPLSSDFISLTENLFQKFPNVGILAFQEIKGVFNSDSEALQSDQEIPKEYYSNDFIGCGFAIRRNLYETTKGFPVWVDIYGEESCVSIEVLAKGYDILYSNAVKINHRVNKERRKNQGQNYFRFGKQLKNTTYYFLVYYPYPLKRILKLYIHNFRKYALADKRYFKVFFSTTAEVIIHIPWILKYRAPVDKNVIKKIRDLSSLQY